jgi:dihydroorotase
MNEGEISARLGLKGWPAVAEEAIIARDVLLAEHVDSRLHICHVTTAGGVEIIRTAKKRGIKVTAEVTPHHLLLTDDLAESYDPVYKVNPPLRTKDDVQALREGLADGTIDVVATDHAPHPHESKDCEWSAAAFGMVGLETAFSIAYLAMVETKLLTLPQLVDRLSKIPAQIGRYQGHGSIALGASGNFTLIDLDSKWRVERLKLASKSKNTPFDGMVLPGVVTKTFHNGALVYERNAE